MITNPGGTDSEIGVVEILLTMPYRSIDHSLAAYQPQSVIRHLFFPTSDEVAARCQHKVCPVRCHLSDREC
jgi:hypothetical protein